MHRYEYKKLKNNEEVKATARMIRKTFARYYNEDIICITDNIQYNMGIDDVDIFYNTFDKYKDIRNTYNELKYHHYLYKKGTTRKDMFLAVCNEEV